MNGVRVEWHTLSRSAWLLLRAGVPVAPWRPGTVYDPRYPVTEADGTVTLRLVVLEPTGTGRDYADDVGVCGVPIGEPGGPVPVPAEDLEVVRAVALAELARAAASRTTVRLADGVTYGVGEESQRSWALLLHRAEIARKMGTPFWPQPFDAADGTVVVLDDLAEADDLFAELFDAANAGRLAALQAGEAIEHAASVEVVVAVLRQVLGG